MEELEIPPQSTTPEPDSGPGPGGALPQTVSIEEWMASGEPGIEEAPQPESLEDEALLAVLEACVYVAEEPLMPDQIAAALNQDPARVRALLEQLVAEFDRPEHGVSIREVAGGYKMATKPEHHEAVRNFVKSLKAPLKLSLPALETLAVIAYKQPVTTPEIMEIRGVQGGGVLKTLLDRKLIAEAGRKNVIGKPILYKTTKEFLIQFGLKDLSELPSLKEFEEIRRMAMADSEIPAEAPAAAQAELNLEPPLPVSEAVAGESEGLAAEAQAPASESEAAPAEAGAPSAEGEVLAEAEFAVPPAEAEATPAGAPDPAAEAESAKEEGKGLAAAAPAAEAEATPVEAEAGQAEGERLAAQAPAPATDTATPPVAAESPAAEAEGLAAEAPAPPVEAPPVTAAETDPEATASKTGSAAPTPPAPPSESQDR
jgi:segregation and condensation protein B